MAALMNSGRRWAHASTGRPYPLFVSIRIELLLVAPQPGDLPGERMRPASGVSSSSLTLSSPSLSIRIELLLVAPSLATGRPA
jgi:hypothetical protein